MDDLTKLGTQAQAAIEILTQQRNAALDAMVQQAGLLASVRAELAECQKALAAATMKEEPDGGP